MRIKYINNLVYIIKIMIEYIMRYIHVTSGRRNKKKYLFGS